MDSVQQSLLLDEGEPVVFVPIAPQFDAVCIDGLTLVHELALPQPLFPDTQSPLRVDLEMMHFIAPAFEPKNGHVRAVVFEEDLT